MLLFANQALLSAIAQHVQHYLSINLYLILESDGVAQVGGNTDVYHDTNTKPFFSCTNTYVSTNLFCNLF